MMPLKMKLLFQIMPLLFCCALFAAGQTRQASDPENNLYYRALSEYLKKRTESWGLEDVVILENSDAIGNLPAQFGGVPVRYLDKKDLISEYKRRDQAFRVFEIRPLTNDGANLVVFFAENLISRRKKAFVYSPSEAGKVEFRYDCEKREFVIEKVELWSVLSGGN
jgi:hypothetical protein